MVLLTLQKFLLCRLSYRFSKGSAVQLAKWKWPCTLKDETPGLLLYFTDYIYYIRARNFSNKILEALVGFSCNTCRWPAQCCKISAMCRIVVQWKSDSSVAIFALVKLHRTGTDVYECTEKINSIQHCFRVERFMTFNILLSWINEYIHCGFSLFLPRTETPENWKSGFY